MGEKKITLETISKEWCGREYNKDVYYVGGGIEEGKFASRRHEDALNDSGKLTLGKATELFKKATGLETDEVKEVLQFAIPNMEWHHAGMLPKRYGGKMKKTYFLNADEICYVANNWDKICSELNEKKEKERKKLEEELKLEDLKRLFLEANAKYVERVRPMPKYFYTVKREMNGKYGWFDSSYKSYNLPEYYTGWEFPNEEIYNEFFETFILKKHD